MHPLIYNNSVLKNYTNSHPIIRSKRFLKIIAFYGIIL